MAATPASQTLAINAATSISQTLDVTGAITGAAITGQSFLLAATDYKIGHWSSFDMSYIGRTASGESRFAVLGYSTGAISFDVTYNPTLSSTAYGRRFRIAHTSTSCTIQLQHSGASAVDLQINTNSNTNQVLLETAGHVSINTGDIKITAGNVVVSGIVNTASSYYVDDIQVVGNQEAAVADATGAGDVVAQLNTLLSRLRSHGLIST